MEYSSKNYIKHTHPSSLYQYSTARYFGAFQRLVHRANPQSILEVGCGEGFVLDYLAKRSPDLKLVGVDANCKAINMAQRISAPVIGFQCANGEKLPFPDNAFDLVMVLQVLEHVENPTHVLAEAVRVARPYVLVTVPLEPYFQWIARLLLTLNIGHDPEHINFWSRRQLCDLLGEHMHIVQYVRCDLYQLALCEKR